MNKRILYFAAMLFAAGCTEKVNMKLDDSYARLVVDGGISGDGLQQWVRLSKSASYFYNQPPPQVGYATVTLSDGASVDTLKEELPSSPGFYRLAGKKRGQPGATYTLNIRLAEPIGGSLEYTASCRIMKSARFDSVKAEFDPGPGKAGHWRVSIYAQEPGDETNYYLFKYYRNGVPMSDSIQKWAICDDMFFNGSYISGLTAFDIDNSHSWETLRPGDTLTVQVCGITREYFNFIGQVQQAGIQIPFFSGPPANVEGNISNGGIGFFTAYSNSFSKCIIPG